MVIGTICRPPDDGINQSNITFDLRFTNSLKKETKYVLADDCNINFLHHDKHSETEQFLNHIFSNSICRQSRDRQGLMSQPLR